MLVVSLSYANEIGDNMVGGGVLPEVPGNSWNIVAAKVGVRQDGSLLI